MQHPMKVVGVIPARLAATRLPNKPLLDICGKPMIQRVWERCRAAGSLADVIVATQDEPIRDCVESFGGRAVMTSPNHQSGTDRVAEAAADTDAEIIVNIQGDEPLLDPAAIDLVAGMLCEDSSLPMSSLMCPCPEQELDSPSTVKVVCDCHGYALYFSRARVPFERSSPGLVPVRQHIGLYGYRRAFLRQFAALRQTPLELTERLEQLRALEHGYRIRLAEIRSAPLSVDTPDDLERVRAIIADAAAE